ncbi:hypothetical protein Nizo3894_1312 [Lactiplantibacillus plantarum]|nr:hypothetical protein Nizo2262_2319 [Lactiplantibacillus plantarum]KZU88060.1 hypothetical protein Nizo3894_1312 [Lactiplantibacillus plantarum]
MQTAAQNYIAYYTLLALGKYASKNGLTDKSVGQITGAKIGKALTVVLKGLPASIYYHTNNNPSRLAKINNWYFNQIPSDCQTTLYPGESMVFECLGCKTTLTVMPNGSVKESSSQDNAVRALLANVVAQKYIQQNLK